jgi:HD-GYP domain-containing protein (c-di-GMP phosphodiesterase class II)
MEKAIEILGDGAGTQWDAQLVDTFLKILPDIADIRSNYRRPPLPNRKTINAIRDLPAGVAFATK